MENYIKISLNSPVLVKLTDAEYIVWWMESTKNMPQEVKEKYPLNWYKGRANAEGFVTFQLWDYVNTFGKHICLGGGPYHEANTLLIRADNVTHTNL